MNTKTVRVINQKDEAQSNNFHIKFLLAPCLTRKELRSTRMMVKVSRSIKTRWNEGMTKNKTHHLLSFWVMTLKMFLLPQKFFDRIKHIFRCWYLLYEVCFISQSSSAIFLIIIMQPLPNFWKHMELEILYHSLIPV